MEDLTEAPVIGKKGTFPATVAKVIDSYKLVINKGSEDGIREGQRMLVYHVSDEDIKDPNTGESLGFLELVRGTGKIIFVQDKISILESDKVEIIKFRQEPSLVNRAMFTFAGSEVRESKELIRFDNPQVGDQVKPI
jgi:hypothetical protein